mmetsp:Transcript_52065/g.161558  ORF Transcript_52065/g.161558 Transcript_52065/m.161558 type:complete len:269 (+) Transcript_52065:42-848(+)
MTTGFEEALGRLRAGSRVAVVTMTGSCCPVTLAHVQCFEEARRILLGEVPRPSKMERFAEAVGLLSLNPDHHVAKKMSQKGLDSIRYHDRARLVELAIGELPWMAFNPGRESGGVGDLSRRWPHLRFVRFSLNGADDVLKYRKWEGSGPNRRGIVMGRPGESAKLAKMISRSGIDLDMGWFVVGPELPDISSTAVRRACLAGDRDALGAMLHPRVAEWCLTESPYRPEGGQSPGGPLAGAPGGEGSSSEERQDEQPVGQAGPRRWRRP